MTLARKIFGGFIVVVIIMSASIYWWFYGAGLSEKTAYKLAQAQVKRYAKLHNINLEQFDVANRSNEKHRLYIFIWRFKENPNRAIIATVDSKNVNITVDQEIKP